MVFLTARSYGQKASPRPSVYPAGLSIRYGFGSYAVKDEYISPEKYSGTMPTFALGWTRAHSKTVYRLEMAYRNSSEITNNNVLTDITQFTLNQGFLYPLKPMSLFKNDLYVWLGPSTNLFFFYNNPDIAVSGFDYAQSIASLISLGLNADFVYPFKHYLQLESALRFTVLSFGIRMVDNEETDDSPSKLLTSLNGLHASYDLGLRFAFLNRLSIKAAYRFELVRIGAWEPLLTASDNVIIDLTFRF